MIPTQVRRSHCEKHRDRDIPVTQSSPFHFCPAVDIRKLFSHATMFYFHSFCLSVLVLHCFCTVEASRSQIDWISILCKYRMCRDTTVGLSTQHYYSACLPNRTQITSGSIFSTEVSADVFCVPIYRVALIGQNLLFLQVIGSWMVYFELDGNQ